MICWSCQTENSNEAKFCSQCGSKLRPDPVTEGPCRSCGAPLPVEAHFCGYCGTAEPVVIAASAPTAPVSTPSGGEASALAYDDDELDDDEEATIVRPGLEEPPLPPGPVTPPVPRPKQPTEPAQVASSRIVERRLTSPGGGPSPGAYSKQGPSLRARPGGSAMRPPPPPAIGAKPTPQAKPKPKPKTVESRAVGKPGPLGRPQTVESRAVGTAGPLGPPPAAGAAVPAQVRPARPGEGAPRPFAKEPSPGWAEPESPSTAAKATTPEDDETGSPLDAGRLQRPDPLRKARPRTPRTLTEPQKAVYSSPRPETAAILAPPEGWPDITDDLAEVRFSAIQGFDEDTRRAISDLRARFPGHPEVDILAEELGEATRSGPSPFPAEGSGPTPVEGPPPLGRFPVGTPGADELEVSLDSDESASASVPVITGNTLPPPSASSEPTSLEDDEPEGLELPANLISRSSGGRSSTGAPEPTPAVTSDELLDLDVLEFDSLVEDRSVSSGPTLLDELDLDVQEPGAVDGAVTGDVSGSTEPSPAAARAGAQPEDGVVVAEEPAVVESAPTPPTSVAGESLHDISFDFDDDHDDADGFIDEGRDRADRTMMVRGYQPPAPYGGGSEPEPIEPSSSEAVEPEPEPEPEAVEVEVEVESSFEPEPPIDPELIVEDERSPTLTPLGEYDSRSPDELETTLPPGNFTVGRRLRSTLAPDLDAVPSSVEASPTPMPQSSGSWSSTTVAPDGSPSPEDSGELYSPSGMTAPDRDSDSAAASGEFRVSDLGLDDLPDLEASSSSMPPLSPAEPPIEGGGGTRVSPAPGPDGQTTSDGTVIARAPLPPMPYGAGRAPVPVTPVRLVMLGARGEPVAERRIEPGSSLDIGRMPGEPWASDRRMEPLHARLFPAPGGLVVDDFGAPQGVYTQISDTIAIEDGDEFKVGQARLALQRVIGPDGVWGQLTLVRHDDPSPSTYRLDRNEILVGREDGDITLPNDTFVSGDHCRFSREGNAVYLEDLGSSNGTYIRVRAGQCVAFGGLLLIGHTQFRVYAD